MKQQCRNLFVLTAGSPGVVAAGNESQHVVLSGQITAVRAPETQSLMDDDALVLAVGAVRREQIPAVVVPYPDGVGKVRRAVWGE